MVCTVIVALLYPINPTICHGSAVGYKEFNCLTAFSFSVSTLASPLITDYKVSRFTENSKADSFGDGIWSFFSPNHKCCTAKSACLNKHSIDKNATTFDVECMKNLCYKQRLWQKLISTANLLFYHFSLHLFYLSKWNVILLKCEDLLFSVFYHSKSNIVCLFCLDQQSKTNMKF